MRWPVGLVLVAGLAAAGCGGGEHHASQAAASTPAAATPTVAQQLRVTLQAALHPRGSLETYTPPRATLHANVGGCSGPAGGHDGTYTCTLTPTGGGFAPRSLTVLVKPDGTWSTTIPHNPREHVRSQRGIYGFGLHMPSR